MISRCHHIENDTGRQSYWGTKHRAPPSGQMRGKARPPPSTEASGIHRRLGPQALDAFFSRVCLLTFDHTRAAVRDATPQRLFCACSTRISTIGQPCFSRITHPSANLPLEKAAPKRLVGRMSHRSRLWFFVLGYLSGPLKRAKKRACPYIFAPMSGAGRQSAIFRSFFSGVSEQTVNMEMRTNHLAARDSITW